MFNPVVPHWKRAFLLIFQCLAVFPLPIFAFFFFFLSLSLSLSLSFFFLICYQSCLLSLLLFREKNKLKLLYWKVCSLIISVFLFSCLVLSFKCPFRIISLILNCVSCSQCRQNFYPSKKTTYQTPSFGEVGGCNKTAILITCVFKMWKRFFGPFWEKLCWCSETL